MLKDIFAHSYSILVVGACLLFIALCLVFPKLKKRLIWTHKKKLYLRSDLKKVDSMSGEEFEYFLKAHLEKIGYRADTTKRSHDYGCDLILKKSGTRLVLQAKRSQNDIGIKAIQEIIGAKHFYRADRAIVASNRYFTKPAQELAKSAGIILWDRKEIEQIINETPSPIPVEINELTPMQDKQKTCPLCGSLMIRREGKYGSFNGCSNYPLCKGTRK